MMYRPTKMELKLAKTENCHADAHGQSVNLGLMTLIKLN